jgi:catechol 2,3-dioxygenase
VPSLCGSTREETTIAFGEVLRPGHIQIRVRDLTSAVQHYVEILGLSETARDEAGRVYLKAWDEFDHHSVILREALTPGMDFFGFKVASETALDALARAPWP